MKNAITLTENANRYVEAYKERQHAKDHLEECLKDFGRAQANLEDARMNQTSCEMTFVAAREKLLGDLILPELDPAGTVDQEPEEPIPPLAK